MKKEIIITLDNIEVSEVIWGFEELKKQSLKNADRLKDSEQIVFQKAKEDFERLAKISEEVLISLRKKV